MNSQSMRRLRLALASFVPYRRTLNSADARCVPEAGQIWTTEILTRQSLAGQRRTQEEDPIPVVILAVKSGIIGGISVHLAVPLFPETEMAGPEDLLLPRAILGYRAFAAVGATLTILDNSLSECRGKLPVAILNNLRRLHDFQLGLHHKRPKVEAGGPYLDDRDSRYQFHAVLPERLAYLQVPVLAALETATQETGSIKAAAILWAWPSEELALAARTERRERPLKSVEYSVPSVGAVLRISECMAAGRLAVEVLRDSRGLLEGAEIVDARKKRLATIRSGCANVRCPRDNTLVLRDASGRFHPLKARHGTNKPKR